jgi:hypothetical protein
LHEARNQLSHGRPLLLNTNARFFGGDQI